MTTARDSRISRACRCRVDESMALRVREMEECCVITMWQQLDLLLESISYDQPRSSFPPNIKRTVWQMCHLRAVAQKKVGDRRAHKHSGSNEKQFRLPLRGGHMGQPGNGASSGLKGRLSFVFPLRCVAGCRKEKITEAIHVPWRAKKTITVRDGSCTKEDAHRTYLRGDSSHAWIA